MSNALRTTRLVAIALIFVIAGIWAGWHLRTTGTEQTASPGNAGKDQLAVAASELPDFSLMDLDEQPRSIREWSHQALLINFWATWCAPCRREMPLLQTLYQERHNTAFQVIGIAIDELPTVKAYVTEMGVTYPILVGSDDAMKAAESFGPDFIGLPFSVFVAPGGEVLGTHSGELDRDTLRAALKVMDAVADGSMSVDEARSGLSGDAAQ